MSPPSTFRQVDTKICVYFSEVHKARSRKTGAVVALKKILMHNEKDGVNYLLEYSHITC